MSSIFLHIPHIGEEEKAEVNKALNTGELTCGNYLNQFEKELSERINSPVVLCSSGTAALQLGLHAMGIGPGDEVIVPNMSFVSTINSVLYMGATPVLCDVGDPEYELSIDPEEIIDLITPRTKAIMVSHLCGGYGDIEKILDIASAYKVDVIEDAAQAVGCTMNGKALGTFGKFGVYSFNGNKIITTGGGGTLLTSDRGMSQRVRNLLNQAKDILNPFSHIEMGYNYRISNIHAAIGCAQLKKLDSFIDKKKFIHETYKKKLDIITYKEKSNYWLNVYKVKKFNPYEAVWNLDYKSIETRPIYTPFHMMDFLKKYGEDEYPVSEKLYNSLFCLPSYLSLDEEIIDKVVDEINNLENSE